MRIFSVGFIVFETLLSVWLMKLGWGRANQGISFGLLSGISVWYVLIVLGILAIFWKEMSWGVELILAGGVANLVIRFMFGAVWDYLKLPGTSLWFNLADVLIALGTIEEIWKLILSTKTKII